MGTAVNTAATTLNGGATAGAISGVGLLLNAFKIANLVLGIIAIVYYKGDNRVGAAPSVLMIVSFEVLDVATIFSSLLVEVVFELCTPHAARREIDNRTTPRPINFFDPFMLKCLLFF